MTITVQLPAGPVRATYARVPPKHSTTREWAVSVLKVVDAQCAEVFDDLSDDDFSTVESECQRHLFENAEAFA